MKTQTVVIFEKIKSVLKQFIDGNSHIQLIYSKHLQRFLEPLMVSVWAITRKTVDLTDVQKTFVLMEDKPQKPVVHRVLYSSVSTKNLCGRKNCHATESTAALGGLLTKI